MEHRVKFYTADDLSISYYFPRMEAVFNQYLNSQEEIMNFTDAIELKNSIKIIETGSYSINWTDEYLSKIKSSMKNMKILYKKFFSKASSELIQDYILQLKDNYDYREDFFDIFVKFKYASRLSEENFADIFYRSGLSLYYLLKDGYFCVSYPNFIKEYFLSKTSHLEILLSNYTNQNTSNYYIPRNISKKEWNSLLEDYIDDRESNLNYLRLLLHPIKGLDNQYFEITPRQRLEIQRKSNAFNESFDETNSGLHVIFEVYFDKLVYEKRVLEYEKLSSLTPPEMIDKSIINNLRVSAGEQIEEQLTLYMTSLVDKSWLIEKQDSESIFTYLSEDNLIFSEKNMLLLPSFPNKETLGVANSIGVYTKNSYDITQYFQIKQQLVCYKIMAYQKILKELNSSIENIVNWYFFDYLQKLNFEWLPFTFSPQTDATDNKVSTIFKNEEKIRKQYKLLIEENEINNDLYNLLGSTPPIEQLPSIISKKYAYLTDNKTLQAILVMLFSDQSHLTYIDEMRNARNLVELIELHKIKKSDFLQYQQSNIQFLLDNEILLDDINGLCFLDNLQITVLKELYWFGEVNYFNSSDAEKKILDKLYEAEMIEFGESLFSKSESDYLNFLINNSKFDNSWGIRNKYQHGSPSYEHEENYYLDYSIALLVLVIYIVKINEEIAYKIKIEKEE